MLLLDLLQLVMSLLQPSAGEIRVQGIPLETLGLRSYRACIAGVMQDDVLISGSIRDNITFFDPLPDEAMSELLRGPS